MGSEEENGLRSADGKIGGKYSENSVLPRAMLPPSLESSGTQSNCPITYLPRSGHSLEGLGQQRAHCQVFLKSAPLDWSPCTQMVCLPPAHPSLRQACLKLNAPCETGKQLT